MNYILNWKPKRFNFNEKKKNKEIEEEEKDITVIQNLDSTIQKSDDITSVVSFAVNSSSSTETQKKWRRSSSGQLDFSY